MRQVSASALKKIMVAKRDPTITTRTCKKCEVEKKLDGNFYFRKGVYRGECKACCIKRNYKRQQETKYWMSRFIDGDKDKSYMVDYYSKNKEKFKEYNKKFKESNPEYHKLYARRKKDEKRGIGGE